MRRIRLIEIPDEFEEISECIEGAWESYLREDSRKCLIALSDIVRKLGYEKIEEKDGKRERSRTGSSYLRSVKGWRKTLRRSLEDPMGLLSPNHIGYSER
ncbi:hypothetical protein DRO02_07900 [archaeon]|nr:MAG: hypothetical protein DRO02_07900 [archaeon]